MRNTLPILLLVVALLVVALLAVALWHTRTRVPDDRHDDTRPVSENGAQPMEVPQKGDEDWTEVTQNRLNPETEDQPFGDEAFVRRASRHVSRYGFAEIDKKKQPSVERRETEVCVTFPRIAASAPSTGRDFAVKVVFDSKSLRPTQIVGATIQEQPVAEATGKPISDEDAIAIALNRILELFPTFDREGKTPSVLRSDAAVFVTFRGPPLPPHTRGADFAFIITIDAKSMEVLEVLLGR